VTTDTSKPGMHKVTSPTDQGGLHRNINADCERIKGSRRQSRSNVFPARELIGRNINTADYSRSE
jgi:hypothetical protein